MKYLYFIGEGPEAENLIQEVKEAIQAVNIRREAFCSEQGCSSLAISRNGQGFIMGLFFDKEVPEKKWLSFEKKVDGKFFYTPNKRTKKGRELRDVFGEESKNMAFSVSDFIVRKLGISRSIFDGMSLYFSSAGFAPGKVLAQIPTSGKAEGEAQPIMKDEPLPKIPAWMNQVKQSEFLAATGD